MTVAAAEAKTHRQLEAEAEADDGPITFSWPTDMLECEPDEELEALAELELEDYDPGWQLTVAGWLEPEPIDLAVEPDVTLPLYSSPLAVISSPLPVPATPHGEPTEPEHELAEPAPGGAAPRPATRSRRRAAGTAAVVAMAAAAAAATNLVSGDGTQTDPKRDARAMSAPADTTCLREWNTTTSADAAQLRVTLGQFKGALARVTRVEPLPGTLMAPRSCGLTVYEPSTDTHAVFVSGVKDALGYLDVTSYPRASEYGWPGSARDANVTIMADGSIRAL